MEMLVRLVREIKTRPLGCDYEAVLINRIFYFSIYHFPFHSRPILHIRL
jgi:hypothetical protein